MSDKSKQITNQECIDLCNEIIKSPSAFNLTRIGKNKILEIKGILEQQGTNSCEYYPERCFGNCPHKEDMKKFGQCLVSYPLKQLQSKPVTVTIDELKESRDMFNSTTYMSQIFKLKDWFESKDIEAEKKQ